MSSALSIGELAKRTHLTTKAIRYYEEIGLLDKAQRSAIGYRLYTEKEVETLLFIQNAKALGMSLGEIKHIQTMWAEGVRPCAHVSHLLEDKIQAIKQQIERLTLFHQALVQFKHQIDDEGHNPDVPCDHVAAVAKGKLNALLPITLNAIDLWPWLSHKLQE